MTYYKDFARRVLIRLQANAAEPFSIDMLTAWNEYNRRYTDLWLQDIRQNPAVYSPHVERAIAFYSEIQELWQAVLKDDLPDAWTETPAWDLLYRLMRAIFETRTPPELEPLKAEADKEVRQNYQRICSLDLPEAAPPAASPAEIDFVPLITYEGRSYFLGQDPMYDGLGNYFAGHDPLVFAIAARVHRIAPRINIKMKIIAMTKREYYYRKTDPQEGMA